MNWYGMYKDFKNAVMMCPGQPELRKVM